MKKLTALLLVPAVALLVGSTARAHESDAHPRMRTYYVGFLYKGASWSAAETPQSAEIQKGHMANMRRLADEGKLILAGPMGPEDKELRGLFIFRVDSKAEAQALCDSDPAIKAGRLRVELHAWYAPEGIRVAAAADDDSLRPPPRPEVK